MPHLGWVSLLPFPSIPCSPPYHHRQHCNWWLLYLLFSGLLLHLPGALSNLLSQPLAWWMCVLGRVKWGRGTSQAQEVGLPHWVGNSQSQVPSVWSRGGGRWEDRLLKFWVYIYLLGSMDSLPHGENCSQRGQVGSSNAQCLVQRPWLADSKGNAISNRLSVTRRETMFTL